MTIELKQLIAKGANKLDLSITDSQIDLLTRYIELLSKWNKVFSLTAITNQKDMVKHHILDALSAIKYFVDGQKILDVGSGMGVPAVVLAIMLPNKAIVAIDSNVKKTSFLIQVKIELKLVNLTVINQRVEELDAEENKFDIITSRAFADLNLFTRLTKHLLTESGYYLAFKGEKGLEEANLLMNWQHQVIKLNVPYLDVERFLIKMERYD